MLLLLDRVVEGAVADPGNAGVDETAGLEETMGEDGEVVASGGEERWRHLGFGG